MTEVTRSSLWIESGEIYDPLSQNLFRLLGCTRDLEIQCHTFSLVSDHLDLLGLKARPFVDDSKSLLELLRQPKEYHQAYYTWFDGRSFADQQALSALKLGDVGRAQQIWKEMDETHSQHNLALLDYLNLLQCPDSDHAWRSVLANWSDLATLTNVDVYADTVEILCRSLERTAIEASRRQRPDLIRRCLTLLESAYSEEQLDAFQTELLETDARTLELACAEVRNTLADFFMDTLVMETAQNQINSRVTPIAEFLLNAALPNSPFGLEVRQEVSLVLRATARAWGEMKQLDRQKSCLEAAAQFSRPEDAGQMHEELLRVDQEQLEALPVTVLVPESQNAPAPPTNWTALLGLAIIAILVLCFFATTPPAQSPSKTALQKRLKVVLRENDAVLNELKAKPDAERTRQLRQRNQELRSEMSALEKALKSR